MTKDKAIIFDMDGVLVNSEWMWQAAEKEVFTSVGVDIREEYVELTKFMTTSDVTRFWYAKQPWAGKNLAEVEQMVIARVIDLIRQNDCQIKGIETFIERMRVAGFKIGLATNSPHVIIPVVLKKLDIFHLFDTFSSTEFEQKGKPDPAVYLRTATKLFVHPKNCIAIEDSPSGIIAAKQAGMKVLAFTNGQTDLKFSLADYQFDDFTTVNPESLIRTIEGL